MKSKTEKKQSLSRIEQAIEDRKKNLITEKQLDKIVREEM